MDDWAIRKGRKYGIILVDLKRQTVVDLLPDRTSEELTKWLREHPGVVELITRDRLGRYAERAKQGAPNAIQAADRFRLLTNLNETLKQISWRTQNLRSRACSNGQWGNENGSGEIRTSIAHQFTTKTRSVQKVQQLRLQGKSFRNIAASLDIAVNTALKYATLQEAPHKTVRSTRKTIGFITEIAQRWNGGTREVK